MINQNKKTKTRGRAGGGKEASNVFTKSRKEKKQRKTHFSCNPPGLTRKKKFFRLRENFFFFLSMPE